MHNQAMQLTQAQESAASVGVSEAARISGFSADTIRRYADQGILPSTRTPKNHRRFRVADVQAIAPKFESAS